MKKFLAIFCLAIIVLASFSFFISLSSVADAATATSNGLAPAPAWKGIVPCGRNINTDNGEDHMCTLCDLIVGIKRIFDYGLYIVVTIAFIALFISGVIYIISIGDEKMMTMAKGFLRSALVGFALVAGAWLIVNVTLTVISYRSDMSYLGIGKTSWNSFSCTTEPTAPSGSSAASKSWWEFWK